MRFMMLVKGSPETEAGKLPPKKEFEAMARFNEQLAGAGVMKAGEGLHPSRDGARVTFGDRAPKVTRGPFAHPEELVCGFWLLECDSLDEAIGWAKKVPFTEGTVEVRQIQEIDEFPEELQPMFRKDEQLLKAAMEHRH